MEQTPGVDPANGTMDKSKVLNVKPLRSLVPVFPSLLNMNSSSTAQESAPFVCVGPSGPFPSGFSPIYPFFGTEVLPNQGVPFGNGAPISTAVPINSFRTPQPSEAGATPSGHVGASNGNTGLSVGAEKSSSVHAVDLEDADQEGMGKTRSQKRTRGSLEISFASPEVDADATLNNILASHHTMELDTNRKSDGDREAAGYVLMIFDLLRRKLAQLEDSKEHTAGQLKRPDLKGGAIMLNRGIRTNGKRRIGSVPGVEVGDIFYFRMEMCVVGLHAPSMAGIDYIKVSPEEQPLAVSIVSSGGYDDNDEGEDMLIYSGQGGNIYKKDKEIVDQKLERGNLALEKSLHRGNEVRVIRGIRDLATPTGKIYLYDGLYKIQESWVERGKSGSNVFKYKLLRMPSQPDGFKIWKSVQLQRDGINRRLGVIVSDLTSGAEHMPVALVNDVDEEKGPAYFTYSPSLMYTKPVNPAERLVGCACVGGCLPGNQNCPCIQKNGGYLPYTANGVLVDQKSLIYECGPSCHCPPNCRNRVSQGGLKVRLEVFKTPDKGWGLRSWDPIRAGAFICEYVGEVISDSEVQELRAENGDIHIFDATRTYHLGEVTPADSTDPPNLPFPLMINAKSFGNVARFMNHSCSPSVFWQPVMRANSKELDLHIVFHAIRHIPPMKELAFNYGMVPPDKTGQGRKNCLCGSQNCRGFFY